MQEQYWSKTYVVGGGGGGRGWVRGGARCAASGRGQAQAEQKYRQPGVGSRYMAQAEQKYGQPGVGSRYRAHGSRITHSPHPASKSVIKILGISLKVPSGQIGSAWEWYHWIGLKKDINRCMNIWEEFKVLSRFIQNESNLLVVGITVCLESFLPIGYHTFICWKIRQSAALFLFGLRIVGFLQIFSSQAVIQEQLLTLPHFCSTVRRKRTRFVAIQPVIPTRRMIRGIFVWSGSELWPLLKYSRSKLKNQKQIAI